MARAPLLQLTDISLTFGGNPVFEGLNLTVQQGDRLALVGRNGSGKSTLMKVMAGLVEPDAGQVITSAGTRVGYMEQDPDLSAFATLGDFARAGLGDAEGYRVEMAAEGLKFDPDRPTATASGGERRRAALARLLAAEPDLMLLDEPTNHLDIPSQEVLQSALESFDGTILLVTHDRYLVDRLASQVWELRRDDDHLRLEVFKGPYQEYLAARQVRPAVAGAATPAANGDGADGRVELSKNEIRRRAEALAAVEAAIAATETELAGLGETMQAAAEAQDFAVLMRLTAEYEQAERRLEELFDEWGQMTHEPAIDHRADG